MTPESTGAAPARAALLHPLVLLVVGLVSWPADWDKIRTLLDSARSPEPNQAGREGQAAGYYVGIIGGGDAPRGARSELSPRLTARSDGWINFQEADVVHYLEGDFLQFELKRGIRRTLFGQPFVTNDFGMHDDQVTIAKPAGTFRIAVLGASMDMGWGVKYQDTYLNRLQQWLDARAARQGSSRPRRFEVLNFAVMAYSPLQRLDTLRRKVLEFQPDLVIYSATTLDIRLMEIHLCDMLRKDVDLRYDFLRKAVAQAGVGEEDLRVDADGRMIHKDRLKGKLRPYYWGLYDQALGMMAAECRSRSVPLVLVIIPRVGKADRPEVRAEPVARLKALAAHQALTVFDLSNTFDASDPTTLEIAAWDDHPNAVGHQRLFLALARAVIQDRPLCRLLFPPGHGPEPSAPGGPAPGPRPAGGMGSEPADCCPEGIVARRGWSL
jgi:hypothetical protein